MPDFSLTKDFEQFLSRRGFSISQGNHCSYVTLGQIGVYAIELCIPDNCLEWFLTIRDVSTNSKLYSNWYEVIRESGRSHIDLVQERDQSIKDFIALVTDNEIRVAQRPFLLFLGLPVGPKQSSKRE